MINFKIDNKTLIIGGIIILLLLLLINSNNKEGLDPTVTDTNNTNIVSKSVLENYYTRRTLDPKTKILRFKCNIPHVVKKEGEIGETVNTPYYLSVINTDPKIDNTSFGLNCKYCETITSVPSIAKYYNAFLVAQDEIKDYEGCYKTELNNCKINPEKKEDMNCETFADEKCVQHNTKNVQKKDVEFIMYAEVEPEKSNLQKGEYRLVMAHDLTIKLAGINTNNNQKAVCITNTDTLEENKFKLEATKENDKIKFKIYQEVDKKKYYIGTKPVNKCCPVRDVNNRCTHTPYQEYKYKTLELLGPDDISDEKAKIIEFEPEVIRINLSDESGDFICAKK